LAMACACSTGSRILETEKDGRLYAIALLEAFDEEGKPVEGFSSYSAESEGPDSTDSGLIGLYRKGPQSETLKRWFADLYKYGTAESIAGFYVVFTDYLGSVVDGCVPDVDALGDWELEGKYPPAGSVIYRDPQAAAEALERGEGCYRIAPAVAPESDAGDTEAAGVPEDAQLSDAETRQLYKAEPKPKDGRTEKYLLTFFRKLTESDKAEVVLRANSLALARIRRRLSQQRASAKQRRTRGK
jgi:hypothetical protein